MTIFMRICLSLCAAALFATPANAQFFNPWSGWWGAGYYGSQSYYAPSYTSYYGSPSYTSFYGSSNYGSPSYGCCGTAAPVYAVSYGSSGSGCCAPSCCAPCCDPCGSGCASGSCLGSTPAGTLKPAQDPISDRKSPNYEDDIRSRRISPDADDNLAPVDESGDIFRRSKEGTGRDTGSDSTTDPGMFKDDGVDPATERSNLKPEVQDPLDGTTPNPDETLPGKPVDEKTFFDENKKPADTASLRRESLIARKSSLSEVIAPKRLASRSLPASQRSASGSKLADKSNNTKSDSPRPLRWISAPLAEGHVQL